MKLRLKIVKGSGEGKSFVFTKAPVRIGRGSDNDLVLNDDGISRLQCEIVIESVGVMLRDLASGNGTKVNDVIATETELKTGDSIGMGPVVFEVLEIDASAEIRASSPAIRVMAARKEGGPDAPTPMGDGDGGTKPSTRTPRSPRALVAKLKRRLSGKKRGGTASVLSPYWRQLRFAGLTALLVAVWAVYYIVTHRPVDRAGEVFPIDKTPGTLSYGKGNVDVLTADRVAFSFDGNGGRVVIGYAVASIERDNQVEIVVNGERVGYAPQTANGWTTGLTFVVPRRLLKAGRNIVIFDNLDIPARSGRGDDRWGVGQLSATETMLPKADPARAKQLYEQGRAAFDGRAAAPQNLTRAQAYLEEAELYVATESKPSPVTMDIAKLLGKVNAEQQSMFEAHIFSAEQALRFGDTERARDALRDILRYFPDANDPRNRAAKERLAAIGD